MRDPNVAKPVPTLPNGKPRPSVVRVQRAIPGYGTTDYLQSTKEWTETEWHNWQMSQDARRRTASRTVEGTNLGNRPLGLSQALDYDYYPMPGNGVNGQHIPFFSNPYDEYRRWSPDMPNQFESIFDQAKKRGRTSGQVTASMMGLTTPQGMSVAGFSPTLEASKFVYDKTNMESWAARPALAALQMADTVWENVIAEPAAFLSLAPTYLIQDTFTDGFQFQDVGKAISDAWENKNYISFGQAYMSSPAMRIVPAIAAAFIGGEGQDPFDVDLRNPLAVRTRAATSQAYSLTTGFVDTLLNMAPIPGAKVVTAAGRVVGMSNRVRRVSDLTVAADDLRLHKLWMDTKGAQGKRTNIGAQVQAATESTNTGVIKRLPIIDRQGGAPKSTLAWMMRASSDYDLNADIYLMTIGDINAATRVVERMPHLAYAYGRVGESIRARINAGTFTPGPEEKARIAAAFDSTVEYDEWARSVVDTFFKTSDDGSEMAVLGYWKPMEGTANNTVARALSPVTRPLARAVESARVGTGRTRAAIELSDESLMPRMVDTLIQTIPNGPKIRLVKWEIDTNLRDKLLRTGQWAGSRAPLNVITYSGTRPDDIMDELIARFEQIEGLRIGESFPVRGGMYTEMGGSRDMMLSAAELRTEWVDRLASAMHRGPGATRQAWQSIEDDILYGLSRKYGLTDEQAKTIVQGVRERANGQMQSLREDGYYLNENNEQVIFGDKTDTIAQLADHDFVLPLNQIEAEMKAHQHWLREAGKTAGNFAREGFDLVGSVWRTSMLLKPGYTFRNSIMEPGVSMWIAQVDAILTPDGIRNFGTGWANFGRNNARRVKRATKGAKLRAQSVTLQREYNDMALEYWRLGTQRDKLAAEVRNYGDGGPPSIEILKAEAEDQLAQVETLMGTIRDRLNGAGIRIVERPGSSVVDLHKEIDSYLTLLRNPNGPEADAIMRDIDDRLREMAGRGDIEPNVEIDAKVVDVADVDPYLLYDFARRLEAEAQSATGFINGESGAFEAFDIGDEAMQEMRKYAGEVEEALFGTRGQHSVEHVAIIAEAAQRDRNFAAALAVSRALEKIHLRDRVDIMQVLGIPARGDDSIDWLGIAEDITKHKDARARLERAFSDLTVSLQNYVQRGDWVDQYGDAVYHGGYFANLDEIAEDPVFTRDNLGNLKGIGLYTTADRDIVVGYWQTTAGRRAHLGNDPRIYAVQMDDAQFQKFIDLDDDTPEGGARGISIADKVSELLRDRFGDVDGLPFSAADIATGVQQGTMDWLRKYVQTGPVVKQIVANGAMHKVITDLFDTVPHDEIFDMLRYFGVYNTAADRPDNWFDMFIAVDKLWRDINGGPQLDLLDPVPSQIVELMARHNPAYADQLVDWRAFVDYQQQRLWTDAVRALGFDGVRHTGGGRVQSSIYHDVFIWYNKPQKVIDVESENWRGRREVIDRVVAASNRHAAMAARLTGLDNAVKVETQYDSPWLRDVDDMSGDELYALRAALEEAGVGPVRFTRADGSKFQINPITEDETILQNQYDLLQQAREIGRGSSPDVPTMKANAERVQRILNSEHVAGAGSDGLLYKAGTNEGGQPVPDGGALYEGVVYIKMEDIADVLESGRIDLNDPRVHNPSTLTDQWNADPSVNRFDEENGYVRLYFERALDADQIQAYKDFVPATFSRHAATQRGKLLEFLQKSDNTVISAERDWGEAYFGSPQAFDEWRKGLHRVDPAVVASETAQIRKDILSRMNVVQKQMKKADEALAYDPFVDYHHMEEIGRIEENLASIREQMWVNRQEQATVNAERETLSKAIVQGRGKKRLNIRGQEVDFEEVAYGPKGDAFYAEASSGMSAAQTYSPSVNNNAAALYASARHHRTATATISVQDPNYFDEVWYAAKRYFHGDEMFTVAHRAQEEAVALGLNGDDAAIMALQRWADSSEGEAYLSALGKRGKEYKKSDMVAAYDLMMDLFPTREARQIVFGDSDFTAGELTRALMKPDANGNVAKFQPIVGERIDTLVPTSAANSLHSKIDSALSHVWDYIAVQPETRLARWPFYRRQFETEWRARMEILAEQGVKLTDSVANAQRQAARRDALQKLEKTFYNIRRYNNPVFSLRFVSSFPGAFFNSLYRYLYYLPVNHPGNMAATINMANAAVRGIAVDENGNHVGDIREDGSEVGYGDLKYLVFLGDGKPRSGNTGLRVPVDAITRVFLDNPARSWAVTINVDTMVNKWPAFETWAAENLPMEAQRFLFGEYGPNRGDLLDVIGGTMMAGWGKTLSTWWRGEGSQEWLTTYAWAWYDAVAQNEKNGIYEMPDPEEIGRATNAWMFARVLVQFFSPVAYRQDAPGQLERELFQQIREENPDLSWDDLREKYLQKMGGDWADPYTASTTVDTYGLQGNYSLEALEELDRHSDLARKVAEWDPKMVGLLVMGVNGTFSRAVYNHMQQDGPFSGAKQASVKKTPDQLAADFNADRGWEIYSANRERYLLEKASAKAMGDTARGKRADEVWWGFLNNTDPQAGPIGLRYANPDWAAEMDGGSRGSTNIAAQTLQMVVDDPDFWKSRKDNKSWQLIASMLQNRQALLRANHYATSSEEKRAIKDQYIAAFETAALDPEVRGFRDLWDRYFADEFAPEY